MCIVGVGGNAFNTFYGGKAIFYSSGHRTGFTDDHCMSSYRNTRAHNSILVNGILKIGEFRVRIFKIDFFLFWFVGKFFFII